MSRSNDFTKCPPKQDKRTISAFLGILTNENGCAVVKLTCSQFFGGSKVCSFLFIYNTVLVKFKVSLSFTNKTFDNIMF